MTCGIYTITHRDSSRCYVGSSYVIERRWKRHQRELDAGKHPNPKLQSAWNKYGSSAFDFAIVEESTEQLVLEREQEWLDRLDAVSSGFNIMPNAGNSGGFIPDAATREKMAAAKRGIPRTAETRAKISAYQKIKPPISAESRAKMSASKTGYRFSEASRQKMSASAKTRPPQSAETRAKRGAAIKAALERKRNVSNPNP